MRAVYIYTLVDPRSGLVRYVGKTVDPKARMFNHRLMARARRCRSAIWIRKLSKIGLAPLMQIVEACDEVNWSERERHWISTLRASGVSLLNHTDGGEGCLGRETSAETRERIGAAQRGKTISAEHRAALSRAHKVPKSPEWKASARAARRRQCDERQAMVAAAVREGLGPFEMRAREFTLREIGRAFGVCHHTIKSILGHENQLRLWKKGDGRLLQHRRSGPPEGADTSGAGIRDAVQQGRLFD